MYNDLLLDRLAATQLSEQEERINELIDEIEALNNLLSPEARELIQNLRPHIVTDDVYEDIDEHASFSDRVADRLANFVGGWFFILSFVFMMMLWISGNIIAGQKSVDPYPFILLNLMLSTLAGLQAPVILMAQNRQSEKDRAMAQNDFQVNLKSELEIADLHRKMDDLFTTINSQTRLVNALVSARRQELSATVRLIENARKTDTPDTADSSGKSVNGQNNIPPIILTDVY